MRPVSDSGARRDARAILAESRVVAVVGCSATPWKPAHTVPARLQDAGYRVVPVHPRAPEILGEPAYPRLADVPHPVDLVVVFRPSHETAEVARAAAAVGAPALWLQLGIVSAEARAVAESAGMDYVEDRCTAVDIARWGLRAPETS